MNKRPFSPENRPERSAMGILGCGGLMQCKTGNLARGLKCTIFAGEGSLASAGIIVYILPLTGSKEISCKRPLEGLDNTLIISSAQVPVRISLYAMLIRSPSFTPETFSIVPRYSFGKCNRLTGVSPTIAVK